MVVATLIAAADVWASYPIVRNFTRDDYGAGAQNWAIEQDRRGRMLFGNRDGLLIYDGAQWRLSRVDNYSTVRSIAIDGNRGVIYVGATEDFGYFHNDSINGDLRYKSLASTLAPADRRFNEIWGIYIDQGSTNIWFRGDYELFRYDGTKTERYDIGEKMTASNLINGRLYIAPLGHGVARFGNGRIELIDDGGLLKNSRVVAILPVKKHIVIVTEYDGLFLLDDNHVKKIETPIDMFLATNQTFSAISNDKQIVFGTVSGGAAICDINTREVTYVNRETGLQNNTVLAMGFDNRKNLWLGLDNGISLALCNSPLANLLSGDNNYGAGYVSALRDGTIYLGTNQGLYSQPYPLAGSPKPDAPRRHLSGQVWTIGEGYGDMFAGTDAGLYELRGNGSFEKIDGVPGTLAIKPFKSHPGKMLASTYGGFFVIDKKGGRWVAGPRLAGYDDIGGRFHEDEKGDIWIAHWMKGVYKLHADGSATRFDRVELLDTANGLPTSQNNIVNYYDDRISFATEGGFYDYDATTGRASQERRLNEIFGYPRSARVYQTPWNDLWSVTGTDVLRATYGPDGAIQVDTTSYQAVAEKIIAGSDHFNFISPDKVIVAIQDGFYEVDTSRDREDDVAVPVFVSRIFANQDSLVYTAPLEGPASMLTIPHELNSLRFEFVSPEFRSSNSIEYSYCLENYDHDWSSYSNVNRKEYTQLDEGSYRLRVRARNTYDGTMSESVFDFRITPPWHRTLWAKIIYVVLAMGVVFLLYRTMRRVSRLAAKAVEQRKERELTEVKRRADEEAMRKDYEIAHLRSEQLEHDIRHKSQELSNTTLNVIRKNEILLEIADRLSKISQGADRQSTVGRQIAKIQNLIKENMDHDDDWRNFTHNFDVVYENFTKRLLELHPNLNGTDQRICCYLKMGLSSKEIAPLFNISYRSVEMSRYRLRKKMGLEREVNLVDYLQRL